MVRTKRLCRNNIGKVITFIVFFIMCFTFIPFMENEGATASAGETIKIGDYVQMGTYYEDPILWRCVAFYKVDEDGNVDFDKTSATCEEGYLPLMLSDKILCLKCFDAAGPYGSGSHLSNRGYYTKDGGLHRQNRGSNYWGDSNIRVWLNSAEKSVYWPCKVPPQRGTFRSYNNYTIERIYDQANSYDGEAGFLSKFTQNERNCIKSVTQKQILDRFEYSGYFNDTKTISLYGETYHQYKTSISECVSNYADAYKDDFTDAVFLLNVNQVNEVYKNDDKLGNNKYYIGVPTDKCVSKCSLYEYGNKPTSGEKFNYWLSTSANSNTNDCEIRTVNSSGEIYANTAHDSRLGVRPAFYLDLTTAHLVSGDGSSESPYTFVGTPSMTIDYSNVQTNEIIDNTIEYKKSDEDEWNVGTGEHLKLEPGSIYNFRVKGHESLETALTIPERPETPSQPEVLNKTDSVITLQAVDGCEYKYEGGYWETDPVFSYLNANQQYTFYQRVKATDSSFPSDLSAPLVVKTKASAPEAPKITIDCANEKTQESIDNTIEYMEGNGAWVTGTGDNVKLLPGTTYKFRIKETDSAIVGTETTITAPARQTAPDIPAVSSKTDTTVTLALAADCEYKCDNGEWQSSNLFENLTPDQNNTFYQRLKATDSLYCSNSSLGLRVGENGSTPEAPVITIDYANEKTSQIISDNIEYKQDNESKWTQGTGSAVSLEANATYKFRFKATENNNAGDETSVIVPARPEAPSVTIDYYAETADTLSIYEYSTNNGKTWTDCTENMSVSQFAGYTMMIRVKATIDTYASSPQSIQLKARQYLYAGPTVSKKTDTTVTLMYESGYEYRCNYSSWQDNNVFTGLNAGQSYTFYKRAKATASSFRSYDRGTQVTTKYTNSWETEPGIENVTYGTAITTVGTPAYGSAAVIYEGINGTSYSNSTVAPTNAGEYQATFSVAETDLYIGLTKTVTFTIEKAEIEKPTFPKEQGKDKIYTFNGEEQVLVPDGFDADTMTISGNVETNANESGYTVTVAPKNNYKWGAGGECDFTWIIGKAEMADENKIESGTLPEIKGSIAEIVFPTLPDGASFGEISFDGVTDVSGNIQNGKLILTVNENIAENISDFKVSVPVNGCQNYKDYTITVKVKVTHQSVTIDSVALKDGKIELSVGMALKKTSTINFIVACYSESGKMLGAAIEAKNLDGTTETITLNCPAGVKETDVATWKVMALDANGFVPLGQSATLNSN